MNNPFSHLLRSDEAEAREAPVPGLAYAVVANATDEGYELDFLSGSFTERSAPARVATFMAGSERGAYFMPEVGDEVVVGFELGNLDRPVILGALWSDTDRPPPQADTEASNNVRTIVSRSGHEITLDDSPGAGRIVIKTAGSMEITLEDAPPGKITIKTTGAVATSRIVLDGISWNHQHPTGVGPSGPPVSITPVT
jgi:uncharacterized protein involved in type VI secretion and phage assembly